MKGTAIGEWVKGPYATTTIEGFIVDETSSSYMVVVNKVYQNDTTPPRLTVGSVHDVPKRAVERYYVKFNKEQQFSLIQLAQSLKQGEWAYELTRQFSNPLTRKTPLRPGAPQSVYSPALKRFVKLVKEVREKLIYFYKKSLRKGAIPLFNKPDDIKSAEALDVIIMTIVFASKCVEGILYIKKLCAEGDVVK